MNKSLKMLLYVFAAYIIITFVNALMMILEILIAVISYMLDYGDTNLITAAEIILLVLNFVVSLFAYGFVGTRIASENNKLFSAAMILLPLILSLPWAIVLNCDVFRSWNYIIISYVFLPSCGIFVALEQSAFAEYLIAALPSIYICLGYIIKQGKEKYRAKRQVQKDMADGINQNEDYH